MRYLIFLLAVFVHFSTYAQIIVTGIVSDENKKPLEMANLIAIKKENNQMTAFGTTNAKGEYKLELRKNTEYIIKASYVGLKTTEITINTDKHINQPITLLQDNTLDTVEIVHKMPVSVRGDTLVYDADSFTTGKEKKLEDVLKKLPGFSVENDGEVKVQGKKINQVMVDGKKFFDGNTKLATKNIPADAVDKVEVLRNHNEVSQMKDVMDNEDNLAMNIKLKEGKKNFWFGELSASVGLDKRYLTHPKLFYHSPKYSINIITDLNNIGEQPFTFMDYFKFTGGFKNASRGTNINLRSDMNFLMTQNNKAKESKTKFGAVNVNYSPTKEWQLDAFAIFSGNKVEMTTESNKSYLQTASPKSLNENTSSNTLQNGKLGLFKFTSQYKPHSRKQLNYSILTKLSDQEEDTSIKSSVLKDITQSNTQKTKAVNQQLNYYYTLSDRHIFALDLEYHWEKDNPFYRAILEQFSFANLLRMDKKKLPYDINQDKETETKKADAFLDYYYILNNKSNLNFSFGVTHSNQDFYANLFQKKDKNEVPQLDKNNRVTQKIKDYQWGVKYRLISGIFTFNPGLHFHYYDLVNEQNNNKTAQNFTKVLPEFSINMQLRRSENIRLRYAQTVKFPDVNKIAERYVLNHYNNLFLGNKDLSYATNHTLSMSYRRFSSFNFSSSFINLSYSRKKNEAKNTTQILGTNRLTSPTNLNLPDESIYAMGHYDKRFRQVKWSINGNISYLKSNSMFLNADKKTVHNKASFFTQSYETKLNSNFDSAINFDVGYRFNIDKYNQSNSTNTYIKHSPFVGMELSFLKHFLLMADYTYHNYSNRDIVINRYSFFDAELNYKRDNSKWEYSLIGTNLLNTKSLNTNFANNFLTSTSAYVIQPRYVVLRVTYNL